MVKFVFALSLLLGFESCVCSDIMDYDVSCIDLNVQNRAYEKVTVVISGEDDDVRICSPIEKVLKNYVVNFGSTNIRIIFKKNVNVDKRVVDVFAGKDEKIFSFVVERATNKAKLFLNEACEQNSLINLYETLLGGGITYMLAIGVGGDLQQEQLGMQQQYLEVQEKK
jgi:hypothetical protein